LFRIRRPKRRIKEESRRRITVGGFRDFLDALPP
jgi:hypothetical protein